MAELGITKPNTVAAFAKPRISLRLGSDAVACFMQQLDRLSEDIVKAAEANALKADRKTIMEPDIVAAIAAVTGSTSNLPFLFKQLEALNAKDTAALSDMIQTWVDAH